GAGLCSEGRPGERARVCERGAQSLGGPASQVARRRNGARRSRSLPRLSGSEGGGGPGGPAGCRADAGLEGCLLWHLLSAPARPHLHPRGRAREGARPARAAAEDPVLPLARLAEDRPELRSAPQQPPLPEVGGREMTLTAGSRLGPYEVLSPLGAGGMGEVYRARDSKLDRDVAIKVLPPELTSDPEALARFEREAKAVAALSHPNILAIHDFGTHGGVSYAVMELLEGETLRGKLDSGPISQKQAVDYALQIAKGLSAAHGKGIVHRDLKPENVFVTKDGHVKILDFGIAKRVETGDEQTSAPTGGGGTAPGTVMGQVGYMAPEQVRGLPVDHRSDIFSLGAILYELLSGRKAFKRETSSDTIAAILKEEPAELTQSGRNIPPALDHIVKHCLEKDRENR